MQRARRTSQAASDSFHDARRSYFEDQVRSELSRFSSCGLGRRGHPCNCSGGAGHIGDLELALRALGDRRSIEFISHARRDFEP
jgi:hypothetical protein